MCGSFCSFCGHCGRAVGDVFGLPVNGSAEGVVLVADVRDAPTADGRSAQTGEGIQNEFCASSSFKGVSRVASDGFIKICPECRERNLLNAVRCRVCGEELRVSARPRIDAVPPPGVSR